MKKTMISFFAGLVALSSESHAADVLTRMTDASDYVFQNENDAKEAGSNQCEYFWYSFNNSGSRRELKRTLNFVNGTVNCQYEVEKKLFSKNYRWVSTVSYVKAPESLQDGLPKCSSADLRSVDVGFRCITTKGSVFERVSREGFGESWMGPDGIIWSSKLGSGTQKDGIALCKNLHAELPNNHDALAAAKYGFREVLPDMVGNKYFSSDFRIEGCNNYYDISHVFCLELDGGRPTYYRNAQGPYVFTGDLPESENTSSGRRVTVYDAAGVVVDDEKDASAHSIRCVSE